MSEADKMFEELGYVQINKEYTFEIRYKKEFKSKKPRHIVFFRTDCSICVCEENAKGLTIRRDYFSIKELKAINKKVEELGWN